MNGIFAPSAHRTLRGFGAIEIPSWCGAQPGFSECVTKQQSACEDDCTKWTDNAPADCIPKCAAAWTDIQCTPGCLAKQPTDPSPTAFLTKRVSLSALTLVAGAAVVIAATWMLSKPKVGRFS